MYTNETTHFGIPLPLGSDLTTPMDYNEAAEAVDAALFEAQGDAAIANENAAGAVETANAVSEALTTISGTVGGHTSQIAALAARMTGAENDITDVRSDLEDMVTAYNEPTATSTHAYSAGDYFIYNDVLYKATDSIAIGATIVPTTNCEAINISSELIQIISDLAALNSNLTDGVPTFTPASGLGYSDFSGIENKVVAQFMLVFNFTTITADDWYEVCTINSAKSNTYYGTHLIAHEVGGSNYCEVKIVNNVVSAYLKTTDAGKTFVLENTLVG